MLGYQNMRYAVENGRDGDGTVFVFSAGNSRAAGDNVNYHNFQNAPRRSLWPRPRPMARSPRSNPGRGGPIGAYGVDLMTTDRLGGFGYNLGWGLHELHRYLGRGPGGVRCGRADAGGEPRTRVPGRTEASPTPRGTPTTRRSWSVNGRLRSTPTGLLFNDDLKFGHVDGRGAVRLAETLRLRPVTR